MTGPPTSPASGGDTINRAYSAGMFVLGVVLPALGMLFFARAIMPTPAHYGIGILCIVCLGLLAAESWRRNPSPRLLNDALAGFCIALTATYAVVAVPLLPVSIMFTFYLLGLLGFVPFAAFGAALSLGRLRMRRLPVPLRRHRRALLIGGVAGLAALSAADATLVASSILLRRVADAAPADDAQTITRLRDLGGALWVQQACEGDKLWRGGPLAWWATTALNDIDDAIACEANLRIQGPAQKRDPSLLGQLQERVLVVHARARAAGASSALSIRGMRLSGLIDGASGTARFVWRFEVANLQPKRSHGGRIVLYAPKGSVVVGASIQRNEQWTRAVFIPNRSNHAKPAAPPNAPLPTLVVGAQGSGPFAIDLRAVPAGDTRSITVEMVVPLLLTAPSEGWLALPFLLDHNMRVSSVPPVEIDIRSDSPIETDIEGLLPVSGGQGIAVQGSVDARALLSRVLIVRPSHQPRELCARGLPGDEVVLAHLAWKSGPRTLLLVIDGSQPLEDHREQLVRLVRALPADLEVGLSAATEEALSLVPPRPNDARQRDMLAAAVSGMRFVGGQDSAAALLQALAWAVEELDAAVLWVHGPQSDRLFAGSAAQLGTAFEAATNQPEIWDVSLVKGARGNVEPAIRSSRPISVVAYGRSRGHLHEVLQQFGALGPLVPFQVTDVLSRVDTCGPAPLAADAGALIRLLALRELDTYVEDPGLVGFEEASAAAARAGIVTPMSAAVVF